MAKMFCSECGEPMRINDDGTSNHLTADGITDFDQDHTAIKDESEIYELAELMKETNSDKPTCEHVVNAYNGCRATWTDVDEKILRLEVTCKKCNKKALRFIGVSEFIWLD